MWVRVLVFLRSGNDLFTITGQYFGPLGTTISVAYGPYAATNCAVSVAHTQATCRTAVGLGTGHRLTLSTDQQTGTQSAVSIFLS